MADTPEITITVYGAVGIGKSAMALAILDALRSHGLTCTWADEFGERNMGTGAEEIAAMDSPKPTVRLVETNPAMLPDALDPQLESDHAAVLAGIPKPRGPVVYVGDPDDVEAVHNHQELEEAMVDASDDPAAMSAALLELARELGCDCNLDDMLAEVDKLQRACEDAPGLRDRAEQLEARATDTMRMLWLVVREAGGAASIPVRSMLTADWSTCQLARSDNLATGDVELFAQVRGELSKPRTTQHQAMHQQLLDMLGAQDHQGGAARIGELVGLEMLLNTGGAGRGVTAIAQERRRQIEGERFDPDADQQYSQGELAKAAACYVMRVALREDEDPDATAVPALWPWARCWWKPKDRRSNLVRAGALIAAELDRMDRAGGQ